jgi:hypothetical protein
MITPRGTLVSGLIPEGGIPPGTAVKVQGANGLDAMCEGREGELLGYSVPHGYAVIACGGSEILVHPEFLVVVGS